MTHALHVLKFYGSNHMVHRRKFCEPHPKPHTPRCKKTTEQPRSPDDEFSAQH